MKTRMFSCALVALAILTYAAPVIAQECDLEPPIGLRQADVVYVPDREDSTISVVDVTPGSLCEFQVIQTIDLEPNSAPTSVFIRPDGRFAFVVQSSRDSVSVISTRLGTEIFQVPIAAGSGTLAGAMSPDGTRLYVSNLLLGSISVVDTENGLPLGDIALGAGTFPIGLAVSPDGTQLWATTEFPGAVVVIDIRGDTNSIIRTISLDPIVDPLFTPFIPPASADIAFDTSGPTPIANVITLGRENAFAPGLGFINLPDALYRIPIDYTGAVAPPPVLFGDYSSPFGPGAAEVIVSRAGNTWISNAGVLDPVTNTPIRPYTNYVTVVPGGSSAPIAIISGFDDNPNNANTDSLSPVGLAKSQPDSAVGDQIYVVNFTSHTMAIFDAAVGGLAAVVPIGAAPVTPYQHSIPALPSVPEFTSPSCGITIPAALGNEVSFTVAAETRSFFVEETFLELSVDEAGLPPNATFVAPLPLEGTVVQEGPPSWTTEVSSDFTWTPTTLAETGRDYVIDFTAEGEFATTPCQVTISVAAVDPPAFDSPPTNGDTFTVQAGKSLTFDVSLTSASGQEVTLTLDAGTPLASLPGATLTPLPATGTPTATTTFFWVPPLGAVGSSSPLTFNGIDALLQPAVPITVHVDVIAPDLEVPFGIYMVRKLKIDKRPNKGTFEFRGAFALDGNSDGIDPLTEDVTIQLDGFSLTIPAGSFSLKGRRDYKFNGVIDGVRIKADLKAPHDRGRDDDDGDDDDDDGDKRKKKGHPHNVWTFKFKGKNADLSSVENRVDTLLQIGDDVGEASKRARIKG